MCGLPSFLLFHQPLFHSLSNISHGTIRQNQYVKSRSRVSSNPTAADPTWLRGHYFDRQSINSDVMIPFFIKLLVFKLRHHVRSSTIYQRLILMQDEFSNPRRDSWARTLQCWSLPCAVSTAAVTQTQFPWHVRTHDQLILPIKTQPGHPTPAPTPTWRRAADNKRCDRRSQRSNSYARFTH